MRSGLAEVCDYLAMKAKLGSTAASTVDTSAPSVAQEILGTLSIAANLPYHLLLSAQGFLPHHQPASFTYYACLLYCHILQASTQQLWCAAGAALCRTASFVRLPARQSSSASRMLHHKSLSHMSRCLLCSHSCHGPSSPWQARLVPGWQRSAWCRQLQSRP